MSIIDDEDPELQSFSELGLDIGALVDRKQLQYGNSVGKTGDILEALYPSGVRVDQYGDLLLIVRMLDKLCRIANRSEDGQDKGGESPYSDLAGYSLIGLRKDGKENK